MSPQKADTTLENVNNEMTRLSSLISECQDEINAIKYCTFVKINGNSTRNPFKMNDFVPYYIAYELAVLQQKETQLQQDKHQLQQKETLLRQEKILYLQQTPVVGNILCNCVIYYITIP